MSHVFELFKNLKLKKKSMKKVLELQVSLWRSCNFKTYPHIVCFPFLFEHYINKGCGHLILLKIIFAYIMSESKRITENKNKNYAI
jgi:hypothetical protein